MSTSFTDMADAVLGQDGDAFGLRYAVNHDSDSENSTAGATAVWPLAFNRKMEADPSLLSANDLSEHYPAVYIDPQGDFPTIVTRGKHGECTFTAVIYVVGLQADGVTPKRSGRLLAAKVVENIRKCSRLNLDWIDDVQITGMPDDPFTKQLHLLIPELCAGACKVVVTAKGLEWDDYV